MDNSPNSAAMEPVFLVPLPPGAWQPWQSPPQTPQNLSPHPPALQPLQSTAQPPASLTTPPPPPRQNTRLRSRSTSMDTEPASPAGSDTIDLDDPDLVWEINSMVEREDEPRLQDPSIDEDALEQRLEVNSVVAREGEPRLQDPSMEEDALEQRLATDAINKLWEMSFEEAMASPDLFPSPATAITMEWEEVLKWLEALQ